MTRYEIILGKEYKETTEEALPDTRWGAPPTEVPKPARTSTECTITTQGGTGLPFNGRITQFTQSQGMGQTEGSYSLSIDVSGFLETETFILRVITIEFQGRTLELYIQDVSLNYNMEENITFLTITGIIPNDTNRL